MFYGMSSDHHDPQSHHFHQFIDSRTSLSLPINIPHLSFSADLIQDNHNPSFSAAGFDPCPPSELSSKLILQQLHHQAAHSPGIIKNYVGGKNNALIFDSLGLQGERSVVPWSDEEVVALFKSRSSMEVSLPEFTWGHVSRKLTEIGFNRSADECKEKFEEGKHFNSTIISYNELDEYYSHDHQEETRVSAKRQCQNEETKNRVERQESEHNNADETPGNKGATQTCTKKSEEKITKRKQAKASKKRKREDKMERLRGYFEAIVDKVMAQQEELHNRLIENIVKRDEESIALEEAWKTQEMNRNKIEIEMWAKDQANAEERHSTLIKFLKKFTQEDHHNINNEIQVPKNPTPTSEQSPSADQANLKYEKGGGKRWPRDEVLALINVRCNTNNGNDGDHSTGKELEQKGPLWERISQRMMELGYKRSAKRCKEKWENINKYFRKTRDGNKKRSVDSRTCPYFHQLSCLYSGRTAPAGDEEQPRAN